MQAIAGPIGRPKIHYVAPAAGRLDAEMKRFLGWFESNEQKDPLFKMAIAHAPTRARESFGLEILCKQTEDSCEREFRSGYSVVGRDSG